MSTMAPSTNNEMSSSLSSSMLLLDHAMEYEQNGAWDDAIRLLQEYLTTTASTMAIRNPASDPYTIKALVQLGHVYRKSQQLLQSAQSFEYAVDLLQYRNSNITKDHNDIDDNHQDGELAEVLFQLGCIYETMGYVSDAVGIFQGLVGHANYDPNSAKQTRDLTMMPPKLSLINSSRNSKNSLIRLANVLLDGYGKREEALQIYSSFGMDSPLAVMTGVVLDSMNRKDEAMSQYKSVKEKYGGDVEAALHLMMGLMRMTATDSSTSMHLMEKIQELRSILPAHVASSADYVVSSPVGFQPSTHFFTFDCLNLGLDAAAAESIDGGLILEFGVYHGKTIRMTAERFPDQSIHGFDTFSGIPQDWHNTKSGSYSTHGSLPPAPANVQYHVGLFSDTLPSFLKAHPDEPVRFMNIDCDLYSSTKDVLDVIHSRIVPGTIIVFDEYVMNPHWKDDEYKAFQEAVQTYDWTYEYLGISLVSQQAVVRIKTVGQEKIEEHNNKLKGTS